MDKHTAAAIERMRNGAAVDDVVAALVAEGCGEPDARRSVDELEGMRRAASAEREAQWKRIDEETKKRAAASKAAYDDALSAAHGKMWLGLALLLIGVVITVGTLAAADAGGGGTYLIAFGPIGGGIGLILRGLMKKSELG